MTLTSSDPAATADAHAAPMAPWWARLLPGATTIPALRLLERNIVSWRGRWLVFLSVLLEPLLFLLSIGVGVGALVGDVEMGNGQVVPYRVFVATGMLASSAMFGPIYDTTFNFFVKLKYVRLYDAVLATPLRPHDVTTGEVLWSLLRSGIYAAAFLVTMAFMGLVSSPWAGLGVPAALLIGYACAGTGLAASTFMRSFVDFDWVNVAIIPMFLFSTTFFPLSRYPEGLQWLVQITPLYQGVFLIRSLSAGELSWALVVPVAYLATMGSVGLGVASRRMRALLQP